MDPFKGTPIDPFKEAPKALSIKAKTPKTLNPLYYPYASLLIILIL